MNLDLYELKMTIHYLLENKYTSPEKICNAVDGLSLIEGCVVLDDDNWVVTVDGFESEYSQEWTAEGAAFNVAEKYYAGDELNGSVDVTVYRIGMNDDGEGRAVDQEDFTVNLAAVVSHAPFIQEVMGRDGCGYRPDDHDWTSEGEGGLDENPGVWSLGGTAFLFKKHCRKCGLHRTVNDPGEQCNPGDGISIEYRRLDEDEIAEHRKNGSMDKGTEDSAE